MIDQWFKKDIQAILKHHTTAVFIDESGAGQFLINTIDGEFTLYEAHSEIEELHVKYQLERKSSFQRNIVYTRTPRKKLKFIREYCETNGCLEIRYLHNYIKDKVHQTLNLNINLPEDELMAAAKVSVGKDRVYWMDLSHKGATEIFDLEKELLPFIHDPVHFETGRYDAQLREMFYRKVNELLGQKYISKPAKTLATEVVKTMLDGLALGNPEPTLEKIYRAWLDSLSYRDSFAAYLQKYTLPLKIDIWAVSPSHPFRSVDEEWLKVIGEHIGEEGIADYLGRSGLRRKNKQAHALDITFWGDVQTLLEFDAKNIAYLDSFAECVDFYTNHFYRLDRAIRNLYEAFLHKRELLEPFQEHYRQLVSIFLEKWFAYFSEYREEQTGLLQRIIDENSGRTAVIVGDGVAYEIACQIAKKVEPGFKLTRDSIAADLPSETENNMSRIYMDNGATAKIHGNRIQYLQTHNPAVTIDVIKLDEVSEESLSGQFLLCPGSDIDKMGEKFQQQALKYFPEIIDDYADKISMLLRSGYAKVYLVSDHGFVLTGLLSEADKITVDIDGPMKKAERYIRTKERQPSMANGYVEIEREHEDFNYLYFSPTINPFKTPGVYGYSHGGASPQELITPCFCWERSVGATPALQVCIQNKEDLRSVTGELFLVKIQADKGEGDLFTLARKVYLVFFSKRKQINKSDFFLIKRDELLNKEYTFDGHPEIEVQLLDAETKEQLDRAVIRQNKDRDLGGLL